MKPQQMIEKLCSLAPGADERETRLYLRFLVATLIMHFDTAQRSDGGFVIHTDAIGVREWLTELLDAATLVQVETRRDRFRVSSGGDACPRCGHVHQGCRECGEQIGGGRICRCEMELVG